MLTMDEKYLNNINNLHETDSVKHGFYKGKEKEKSGPQKIALGLNEMKFSEKCHCCPYGYHIDLDFVRYCETVANGAYLHQLKRLKRNRRRQRKSAEAILNSHEDFVDGYSFHNQAHNTSGPPPDVVNTGEVLRDALQEAVLDFEDTYLKSESSQTTLKKKSANLMSPNLDLLVNTDISQSSIDRRLAFSGSEPRSAGYSSSLRNVNGSPEAFSFAFSGSRSRSGSTSSLTSTVSTASSFADQFSMPMPNLPSQQMADTMASFTNSFLTPNSGLSASDGSDKGDSCPPTLTMNKSTLRSIREQMAASLQRMRELEDHVKNIPILQVKLSVLKEEKRLLMLQLKAKEVKLDRQSKGNKTSSVATFDMSVDEMGRRLDRLGAMGIVSPRSRRKFANGDRTRSRSESPNSRSKNTLIDLKDFHSHQRAYVIGSALPEDEICSLLEKIPKADLCLRETKNVGVNCSVLTRDVGVSHVITPPKSVGVGVDFKPASCPECIQRNHEPITNRLKSIQVQSCMKCSEQGKKKFAEVAVNADLYVKNAPRLSRSDCKVESFAAYPCSDCIKRQQIVTTNASVVTDPIEVIFPPNHVKSLNILKPKDSFDEIFAKRPDPSMANKSINTDPKQTRQSYANTDLLMDDIISREENEYLISIATSKNLRLQPELCDVGVQTTNFIAKFDKMAQVLLEDFNLMAKPLQTKSSIRNTAVNTLSTRKTDRGIGSQSVFDVICDRCTVAKNSVGVGSFSINDILCDKCISISTKSTASGDHKITDIVCENCSRKVKLRNVASGPSTVADDYCKRCSNLTTNSVAVGSFDVNHVTCDSCSHRKTRSVAIGTNYYLQKSVGTNTKEKDPTDINTNGNVQICDKCSNAIQFVANNFVQKISPTSSAPPPIPSRIPRLSLPSPDISIGTNNSTSATTITTRHTKTVTSMVKTNARTSNLKQEKVRQSAVSEANNTNKLFEKLSTKKMSIRGENSKTLKEPSVDNVVFSDDADSSDSSDSESSDSPDEGSYDGVYGNIVHTCHDDEAIRQGLPGASMFQPISETSPTKHIIHEDFMKACKILNDQLTKKSQISTKELNSSLNLIQQEWFRVSSQKGANSQIVEDYMDAFEDLSHDLLGRIVNLADANGNTAMHYAVSHGNFDVVSLLLDSKVCDISKQNKAGYTCIMLASLAQIKEDSDKSVIRRLFQLGDINVKASQHGQTALMLAVSHGRVDVVKMLLDAGADINIQDEDGSTALMCASEHGHVDIIRVLLSHPDCDPTLKDNDNCTALTIAVEAGHKDIGVLIYAHTSFSRGSSPLSSLRVKKRTPSSSSSTPPSRTPPPPSPASSRKSTKSVP